LRVRRWSDRQKTDRRDACKKSTYCGDHVVILPGTIVIVSKSLPMIGQPGKVTLRFVAPGAGAKLPFAGISHHRGVAFLSVSPNRTSPSRAPILFGNWHSGR